MRVKSIVLKYITYNNDSVFFAERDLLRARLEQSRIACLFFETLDNNSKLFDGEVAIIDQWIAAHARSVFFGTVYFKLESHRLQSTVKKNCGILFERVSNIFVSIQVLCRNVRVNVHISNSRGARNRRIPSSHNFQLLLPKCA